MNALETVRDDDFVEYFLFVRPDNNEIDKEEIEQHIKCLNAKVLEFVNRLSDQFIWHKDQFNLIPRFCLSAELQKSFSDSSDGNECYLSIIIHWLNIKKYFILLMLLDNTLFNRFHRVSVQYLTYIVQNCQHYSIFTLFHRDIFFISISNFQTIFS